MLREGRNSIIFYALIVEDKISCGNNGIIEIFLMAPRLEPLPRYFYVNPGWELSSSVMKLMIWMQMNIQKYIHTFWDRNHILWREKFICGIFFVPMIVEVNQTSATADVTTEFIEKLEEHWECLHNIFPALMIYFQIFFSPATWTRLNIEISFIKVCRAVKSNILRAATVYDKRCYGLEPW